MFTTEDAIDVLTLAAAYDRRTIGQGDVHAWTDAAQRGRWTRDSAFEAVKEHYARSAAWLMPGHVTELIRADRRQPPPLALATPAMASIPAGTGAEVRWTDWRAKRARRRMLDPEERARARAELDARRPADEDAS